MKTVQKRVSTLLYPLGLFQDFTSKIKIDGLDGCFKIIHFLFCSLIMFSSSKCSHKIFLMAAATFLGKII